MTSFLLDTNILSELRRPKPEAKVVAFVAEQPLENLYISVVTLAELRFGIELLDDVSRRSALTDWLTHKVRPMFAQRVLEINEDVMLKWRLLVEEGRIGTIVRQVAPVGLNLRRVAAAPSGRWSPREDEG